MSDSWLDKTQNFSARFTNLGDFNANEARRIQSEIIKLRTVILTAFNNLTTQPSKEWLEQIVHEFHNPIVPIEKAKVTFIMFLETFIKEITQGARLTSDNKRYVEGTIRAYKGFKSRFEEFCKAKKRSYDFDDIDENFNKEFVLFLTNKNYSENTIGRHIKELKSLMALSKKEKYHTNDSAKEFKVLSSESDNVYLNISEIELIKNLDLSKEKSLELTRYLFLIGCHLAQRFSDYSSLRSQNIVAHSDGTTTIELIQQKTSGKVIIPAHPEVLELLKKYDNQSPKVTQQQFNRQIKQVAKLAGITELVNDSQTTAGIKKKIARPKYELITSHTARRSGATNMYLAGIPPIAIMKITGHKTEKDFMTYLKISSEENASTLANHPYFR